jgi:hypothetical protein
MLKPFLNKAFVLSKKKFKKNGKPYIRKIRSISGIDVWLVDGEFVRKNVCEDFVNFDHHSHLAFIPKDEFWIAKEAAHHEIGFYVDHMLAERRMVEAGYPIAEARRRAEVIERGERSKSAMMKNIGNKKLHRSKALEKVRKKALKGFGNRLKIFVVNGELVRSFFYIDFAGGGHDQVFDFIPGNEIWLDDDISKKERKFILLHELHERNLMARGQDYQHAHPSATRIEDFYRHHPRGTNKAILQELSKQPVV